VSLLEARLQFKFKAGNSQSRLSASAETLNCGGIRRADEKLPRRVATFPHSDFSSSPKYLSKNVVDMDGLITASRAVTFLTCD